MIILVGLAIVGLLVTIIGARRQRRDSADRTIDQFRRELGALAPSAGRLGRAPGSGQREAGRPGQSEGDQPDGETIRPLTVRRLPRPTSPSDLISDE